MRVKYERSFLKDIQKINDNSVKISIAETIKKIKAADSLEQIIHVRKIKGHKSAFRIKVKNFRIGLFMENDQIIFSRCLHRKDIYRYFPKKS